MTHSKGISWIDDCRIPFVETDKFDLRKYNNYKDKYGSHSQTYIENKGGYEVLEPNTQGRFPANILVCDDMLNDGVITGENKIQTIIEKTKGSKIYGSGSGLPAQGEFQVKYDKGTNSRYYDIDKWFNKIINYE